jgi:hypothetical protein
MGGVVDAGAGPVAFTVEFASTEDRWLVPGQEILVWVDPAWPQHVEIEWPAIPSIRDRVAAGEPCLVDPVTAIRRVAVATGTAPPDFANTPAEQRRQALRQQLRNSPPPAGLLRAQVFVVSKRPKNGTDRTGGTVQTIECTSQAVLSVQLLDRAPYALFVEKFTIPKGGRDILSAGYSALVAERDRADVRIQWDARPEPSRANPMVPGRPQAIIIRHWTPQSRQMAIAELRMSLARAADPHQRQALINQYRAMGIDPTEAELYGV